MSPLPDEQRRALLKIARGAIHQATFEGRTSEIPPMTGNLGEPGAAFVTLRRRGRLRGCIGQVARVEPLAQVVSRCAAAAAREDPRFSPVRPAELEEIEIEISVLSPLVAVPAEKVAEQVEVGRHGLAVSRGEMRGVLLPQVAEEFHFSRERFLEEACRKGGLGPGAWKDGSACVEVFTAEIFSEADFYPGPAERIAGKSGGYSSSQ